MLLDKLIALMFNVFINIEENHDWEAFMGRPSIALVCLFNAHHDPYFSLLFQVQNSVCILGLIQLVDAGHYARLKQTFQSERQLEVGHCDRYYHNNFIKMTGICSQHSLYLSSIN